MRNVSIGLELVRTALVDDDAFPDGRGELWVSSLTILACCGSTPAATAVLNSWKLSVVFENLVVPVHHLGVQRLVYTLLILTLLLLLNRNCGCPFHASLKRALCVRIST